MGWQVLKTSGGHVMSITFGFILHQESTYGLLVPHNKGHVSGFVRGYHLECQAVHSALAAHFVQIIVLQVIVCKPPFHVGHSRVRQLDLKDGILASDHGLIIEFPDDAHSL